MLRSLLTLKSAVVITKYTDTNDGMGGTTTVTSLTTLANASIWTVSSLDKRLSDKITKSSSHVLAIESSEYTFTSADRLATFNGNTYVINGNQDNVGERNELTLMGLTWQM